MDNITVAIDGPAGAGKSTIAKKIANKLGLVYIDTGAMYRAVTYLFLVANVNIDDMSSMENLLNKINIEFKNNKIILNSEDITEAIRTPKVSNNVSKISSIEIVREKLVDMQKNMALNENIIMDGRDIGTNVLKNANVKIYLTASVEERAKRRFIELSKKGFNVNINEIQNEIITRDTNDSNRKLNPLKKAEDAQVIDTTNKSIDEVVNDIVEIIKNEVNI